MNRTRLFAVLTLLLMLSTAAPAVAWNSRGHMLVAYVAYQHLTPTVRARADALLKLNPFFSRWLKMIPSTVAAKDRPAALFMIAATWPDQIKQDPAYSDDGTNNGERPSGPTSSQNVGYADKLHHKYWHFVDQPFTNDGTPLPSVPNPNAEERIGLFRSVIASSSPDALKSYDLVWLLHLIGDMHQPLHAATRVTPGNPYGDNGGNQVRMCEDTLCHSMASLHAVWDGLLGSQDDVASAMAAARRLPAAAPDRARTLDPVQWVQESFALARADVYQPPVRVGPGPYTLTSAYEARARRIAEARIALAGARLAAVLNRDLTPRPGGTG